MPTGRTVLAAMLVLASGCAPDHRFELNGQVVAVSEGRQEITIKHQDIRGFMPGMTMPFKVKDSRLLHGRAPGDLVRATLVVLDNDAYLSSIEPVGRAALTEPPPSPTLDLLETGAPVPDAPVTDESGVGRRVSEWRGHTLAVTFIYTRCPLPDFCPRMNRQFAAVQRDVLADPRLRDRVRLLSMSFDPEFDTPTVLAEQARRAGADPRVWSFLTGQRDAIERFASPFGVSIIGGGADVTGIVHNLRTAVIGGDGRLVTIFNGNDWTPADLLASLRSAE